MPQKSVIYFDYFLFQCFLSTFMSYCCIVDIPHFCFIHSNLGPVPLFRMSSTWCSNVAIKVDYSSLLQLENIFRTCLFKASETDMKIILLQCIFIATCSERLGKSNATIIVFFGLVNCYYPNRSC